MPGKQPKETIKQAEAFDFYYNMPRRSYKGTSEQKQFNVSEWTVGQWAIKYHWQERVENRAAKEAWEREQVHLDQVRERTKLQQQAYQLVEVKAIEYIAKERKPGEPLFETGGEAVRALDTGIKGEREVMGLTQPSGSLGSTTTTNIQNNITVQMTELAKDEQARGSILRSLKRIHKELTAGKDIGK